MFPDFKTWCDTVLHPEDTHPWNFRTPEFYHEYKTKYAIAKMVNPRTVLEVGVRFGYGAFSFLLASECSLYTGLDFDEPSWGPYKGVPRLWAQEKLSFRFPRCNVITHKANTQTDDVKPLMHVPRYDFVHIDADHSFEGALKDISTFWTYTDRVMVVDDCLEIPLVFEAVKHFMRSTTGVLLLSASSLRGSAMLVRDT